MTEDKTMEIKKVKEAKKGKEIMAEDNRKLDTGDVVGDFEVVGVQYQETPEGERVNFTYLIKDPADIVREEETE